MLTTKYLNKIIFTSAMVMLMILVSACGSGQSNKNSVVKPSRGENFLPAGKYQFSLYDSTDNKLAELELNVETSDTVGFSGSSTVTKTYTENFKGSSSLNSGKFTGEYNRYDKKKAVVNMNPSTYDNNVYITLQLGGKIITGSWSFSTIAGVMNHGKVTQSK